MLTPCPPAEVALEDTAIEAVALSASGETLVSAAAGALQLWDLTELVRRRLQGTSGRCFCQGLQAGDAEDSNAICLDREGCEALCTETEGCESVDMHKTLPRCFLNREVCSAPPAPGVVGLKLS